MLFLLSDQDIIAALQRAERRDDGLLALDLPASKLLENASSRPALTFSESAKTVHCGRLSTRLSPLQFALLRYVHEHGRVDFEDLQDAAWGKEVSDSAIRAACSSLNGKLCECGLSVEIVCYKGRVSLEEIG